MATIAGAIIVIGAIYCLIKQYESRMVLFLAGMAMCLIVLSPMQGFNALSKSIAGAKVIETIAGSMAFAFVMQYTKCDQHLVHLLSNILKKAGPAFLIPGGVLVTAFVHISVPSAAGCAASVGPVLVPILIGSGVAPVMAGSILFCGTFGATMMNPGFHQIAVVSDATGVAPAAILYAAIGATGGYRYFVLLVCLFMIFCGLLRLARYNVISDKIDYDGFVGFPIPGIAMVVATYYLSGCLNDIVAIILMIFAGYLMISTIMYPKIKDLTVLAIGALLILLILIPVDIVILGINIPAILLLILVLIYMLIPCLEFFLEVDDLFTKEMVIKEVNKARQVTGEKLNESMDKAGSKLSSTKEKVSDMKNTVNSFSYDKESKTEDDLNKDDEWLQFINNLK